MTDENNPNPEKDAQQIEDPLVFKLQNEVDEAQWPLLEQHYERGALVFINEKLDLIDVAAKIVRDSVDDIKKWADEGLIYNPKESGKEVDKTTTYRFIITQPYVLIQPKSEGSN